MKSFYIYGYLLIIFFSPLCLLAEDKCFPGSQKLNGGCSLCAINYYNPNEGGSCSPCPSGQQSSLGSAKCEMCGAGTYGTGPGKGCAWCPMDYFNPTPGGAKCNPCPPGSQANGSRSNCDYFYDFGIYRNEYLSELEQKLDDGWAKAGISNFRMFFKSLDYDSYIKDFEEYISGLESKDIKEKLDSIKNLLKTEKITMIAAKQYYPIIKELFDKNFKALARVGGEELKNFYDSLKIFNGVTKYIGKACTVVGFVGAISENVLNNIKFESKTSKFISDFVNDSTQFLYIGAATAPAAVELAALAGFAGSPLIIAGGAVVIGLGINHLISNLKINNKTPKEYYKEFIDELTKGLGDDQLRFIEK